MGVSESQLQGYQKMMKLIAICHSGLSRIFLLLMKDSRQAGVTDYEEMGYVVVKE